MDCYSELVLPKLTQYEGSVTSESSGLPPRNADLTVNLRPFPPVA